MNVGISVVYTDMPVSVRSFVRHDGGEDWDTIVINARLDMDTQKRCLHHEMKHILHNDFSGANADEIEYHSHRRTKL